MLGRFIMSYDLMIFDAAFMPTGRESFMAWFKEQTQWADDIDYNNPDNCTRSLRAWFDDFRQCYPPMNGPLASDDYDNPKVSDYTIGTTFIYIAFAWSEAENAYWNVFAIAQKHKVGFFDVSSNNGCVWIPGADGNYVHAHGESSGPEEAIAFYESVLNKLKKEGKI